MTQEFHISVTPVGQNDYLVRTEQVAPGVPLAEELVSWPVADWLSAASGLMNDPLTSVLQGDVMANPRILEANARNSVNLVALGQQLYNALFQGTLRDSWITAQGIAQNHQQVLRLRLGLKDSKLARLPWEVMHAGDRPLATGPYVAFSRYQSGVAGSRLDSRNMPIPLEEGGIKVLMTVASPTDKARLDLLKQEAIKLQAELHRSTNVDGELPEIQLTLLQQPGREELTQALEQGRYHILHYSGHSNIGANGGEIYLVSSRTGLTETLSGDDLAGLLVNNNIQMAVFNSCLGSYGATSNQNEETGESNLTETLVKRGIRCVLAMSERIPDDVALTLTQLFYRNLSQAYSIDLCVSRMRQGLISAYGSHQMYWALPILYLAPDFHGNLHPEIDSPSNKEFFNDYNSIALDVVPPVNAVNVTDEPDIPLEMEGVVSSAFIEDSSGLEWLDEENWGGFDELDYDNSSYAEDSAIVGDLFRQLDEQAGKENSPVNAELIEEVRDPQIEELQNSGEIISSVETTIEDWQELAGLETTEESAVQNIHNPQIAAGISTRSNRLNKANRNNSKGRKNRTLPFVSAGLGVICMFGIIWWWQSQQGPQLPDISITTQEQTIPQQPTINLKTDATGIVTAYAMEKLNRGELDDGLEAVEELLDRGTLKQALAALKLVPKSQMDEPAVNFLQGRLAWQSIQQRDSGGYAIDDARRYWEKAVKTNPNSSSYLNALGFAYYTEGNIDRANASWLKALNLAIEEKQEASQILSNVSNIQSHKKDLSPDALRAYAGLALGFYRSAQSQSSDKRDKYLNEAINMQRTVLQHDPLSFQTDKLATNWLWTDKAVDDWRSLLKFKR
ncbi:MAG: cell division protein HetF [Cyanobacteria bacterium P01_A01_bin.84]